MTTIDSSIFPEVWTIDFLSVLLIGREFCVHNFDELACFCIEGHSHISITNNFLVGFERVPNITPSCSWNDENGNPYGVFIPWDDLDNMDEFPSPLSFGNMNSQIPLHLAAQPIVRGTKEFDFIEDIITMSML